MTKMSESLEHIADRLPRFLQLLKELEPLILLSTLAIIIAGAIATLSQRAAGYAVGAGMMFLFATILVVLERFVSIWPRGSFPLVLRFAAVSMIGFGLLLLLAVAGELTGVLPGFLTYTSLGVALFAVIMGAWYSDHLMTLYRKTREKPYSPLALEIVFGLIIAGFDVSLASGILLILYPLPISLVVPLVSIPFLALIAGGVGSYVMMKKPTTPIQRPPR